MKHNDMNKVQYKSIKNYYIHDIVVETWGGSDLYGYMIKRG